MDYEKMYKEAVGKIQELLEEKKKKEMTNCLFEGELNEIFSELRESEEEKIRKRIILCLEECVHNDIIRDYEKEQCLAWLEKPKTEKVYLWFKVGDVVRSSNGTTLKIVGITDYCYNCITTDNNVYSFSFDIQDEFELVEDKTEWSKEDEIIVDVLYAYAEKANQNGCPNDAKRIEAAINKLKSLRPHSSYHEGFKKGFAKAKEMHYDHWKPSEEELTAILVARNNVNSINADILRKLYNELKKL